MVLQYSNKAYDNKERVPCHDTRSLSKCYYADGIDRMEVHYTTVQYMYQRKWRNLWNCQSPGVSHYQQVIRV